MDLQQLISEHRQGRTYRALAAASGGAFSHQRLQQIASGPSKEWLKPDTVRALSDVLGVSQRSIVLAMAESLGLTAGDETDRVLSYLPAEVGQLTPEQLLAFGNLVRAFTRGEQPADDAAEGGGGHVSPAANTQAGESPAEEITDQQLLTLAADHQDEPTELEKLDQGAARRGQESQWHGSDSHTE